MTTPADKLIRAFIDVLGSGNRHVTFRHRGGSPGYVHVVPSGFDPTRQGDRFLAVELHNGTVCVTDELRATIGAQQRPAKSIHADKRGHSAGPTYGRFKWALAYDAILAQWDNEKAFALHVCKQFDAMRRQVKRSLP